jgi:hypothetical protein
MSSNPEPDAEHRRHALRSSEPGNLGGMPPTRFRLGLGVTHTIGTTTSFRSSRPS